MQLIPCLLLQPLLHVIIFFIEMAVAIRLIAKFNSYYDSKPILTTMISNAVLGGIADTVAQTLTAIRTRAKALPTTNSGARSILSDTVLEMDDLNEKPKTVLPLSRSPPPPFDFERLTRFMAYGFLMAPVQFHWYAALSRWFPITKARGMTPALQRMAMDQLIFAPIGLGFFFTFMTVAEGGGRKAVAKKFQDVYVPALRANYILWPMVQMINFRVMPVQFQIPFVSSVGIAWTAYLSLTNSADEA
jgi:Mpv17 / PMP22 family